MTQTLIRSKLIAYFMDKIKLGIANQSEVSRYYSLIKKPHLNYGRSI
jgi:hypothetical protein